MPDSKFFHSSGPKTLAQLAELTEAKLYGDVDAKTSLKDVAPLDKATASDLSFLDNIKYKDDFLKTKAGACFVKPDLVDVAPKGVALLVTYQPYKSYALAAQAFYPNRTPKPFRSEMASIHETAVVADSCIIHPGAVIEGDVVLGEHVMIEAGAIIKQGVQIGAHTRVGPRAVISHAIIGEHVNIYPGVCIGQDGFGFAPDPKGFVKVPQLGRVIIGNGVEIGANTCIDRGAGPDTVIGDGTWIDNLVQIGHNVQIGRCCIIVAQVGISGSTVLGDFVAMGGQSGCAGHLKIGTGARIAAQSGIMKDIPPGMNEYMGSPAIPIKQHMRQVVALKNLIQKKKTA